MSAQYTDSREAGRGYTEPPDPWAIGGSEALRESPSFMTAYVDGPEVDVVGWAPVAAPPKPALIVRLENGWTAVVRHPDQPEDNIGRGGQGRVYVAHVYDQNDNALGLHALKQTPLGKVEAGFRRHSTEDEVPHDRGVITTPGASMLRETVIMKHIYRRCMLRNGRAGVPWTITHGRDESSQYMLQEIVGGERLDKQIQAGKDLPVPQVMGDLLATVAAMEDDAQPLNGFGSAVARYGGLVFLDLKPENVLFDPATGNTRIIDAGITQGRLLPGRPQRDYEGQKTFMGTPIWTPPEVCEGKKRIVQSNQYQLALIWLDLRTRGAYSRMRVGQEARSIVIQNHGGFHMPKVRQLMEDYDIPYEERDIMLRALQRKPEDRWPSTQAMLDEFTKYTARNSNRNTVQPLLRAQRFGRAAITVSELPTAILQRVPQHAGHARAY